MHRPSIILCALLALSSCKSKESDESTATKPATRPATEPATRPGATDQPPQKRPADDTDNTPKAGPKTKLACDELLTLADVGEVCGAEVSSWNKDAMETGEGMAYCSRRAGPNASSIRFLAGIYPHIEAAKAIAKGADRKTPKLEKKRAGKVSVDVAHARANNIVVSVRTQHIAKQEPLCNEKQLALLAVRAAARLP